MTDRRPPLLEAVDLHDLVVQRLFATVMMLESTQHRSPAEDVQEILGKAVDELRSTIQEVRTTIFALQQLPDGWDGVRLTVHDDGRGEGGGAGTTVSRKSPM
ncbi:histidine kinase [Streptomyces sp. NPDC001617]